MSKILAECYSCRNLCVKFKTIDKESEIYWYCKCFEIQVDDPGYHLYCSGFNKRKKEK